MRISGRIVSAARALAGISQSDFAAAARLDVKTLRGIENNASAWVQSDQDLAAIARAIELYGVIVVEEGDGFGAGVRLKFSRQDVRQIARLEGEGGITSSDAAP